jgi:hypothetical protein
MGQAPRHLGSGTPVTDQTMGWVRPRVRIRLWVRHPDIQASRHPDIQASRLRLQGHGSGTQAPARLRLSTRVTGSGHGSNHGLGQAQASGSGTQAPGYRPGTRATGSDYWIRLWARHSGSDPAPGSQTRPWFGSWVRYPGTDQVPDPQGQVTGSGQAPGYRPGSRVRGQVIGSGTQAPEPQGQATGQALGQATDQGQAMGSHPWLQPFDSANILGSCAHKASIRELNPHDMFIACK